jgi:hypothetical protein
MRFQGTRFGNTVMVMVERGDSDSYLLPHQVKHSPDGFEWGYFGSGPADLARSILAFALSAEMCLSCQGNGCWDCDAGLLGVPPSLYQTYKEDVIAGLPKAGWTIQLSEVVDWLANHKDLLP